MLSLADQEASDPAKTGGKAAALARALQAGYPVVAGSVVPIDATAAILERACASFADGGERGARQAVAAAQIAIARSSIIGLLEAAPPLVVRSSTNLDGDGRFAGAFASYGGLGPSDLATAVRGCLGSLFSRQARSRLESSGVAFEDVRMAALIQPELSTSRGGWAAIHVGDVEVAWTSGHPGPLLAGAVTGKRSIVDDGDPDPTLKGVAALMRSIHADFGARSIEWGSVGSDVWLLQVNAREQHGDAENNVESNEVTEAAGSARVRGTPGSPGVAHGLVVELDRPEDVALLKPGDVAVVNEPLNAYAPALWIASGLVSRGGSSAAHLCHVARALHVPVVVNVDLPVGTRAITLDGDAGVVWAIS